MFKKLFKCVHPMCPDKKYVVNVATPEQRFEREGGEKILFQPPHENVCIARCHAGTHSSAMTLKPESIIETEEVQGKDEMDEFAKKCG